MARNCSVSLTSVQDITKSRWKRNPGKRHHLIPDLAVFNGRGYPWVFVPLGPLSKGHVIGFERVAMGRSHCLP